MLIISGEIVRQEIIANTIEIFSKVKDNRQVLKIRQLLGEVLLVVFLATMSDCSEDYEDMELFGKHRLEFLRQFYPYKNGAPSDSTICRIMQMIDPTKFQELFYKWVGVVFGEKVKAATSEKDIIAIDGKAIRGCRQGRKSLYMLNVFSHKLGIVISSTEVGEKTNEITALKEVLEILDVKNRIITTDAMGCQTDVAKTIVDKEGDYLFGLKGNQGCTLNDTIKSFEELQEKAEVIEKTNKGHGRLEHKVCSVLKDLSLIENKEKWSNIKSLIKIDSTRIIKDKVTTETRYYITSLDLDAEKMLNIVKSHWSIENAHWWLDVILKEDACRVAERTAAMNLSIIRKSVLNLLRYVRDKTKKSMAKMRKIMKYDYKFFDEVFYYVTNELID